MKPIRGSEQHSRDGFRRRNEGMALLLAIFFASIAVVLLGSAALRVINQDRRVVQYVNYENCVMGLDTGLARGKAALETTGSGNVGVVNPLPHTRPTFDDTQHVNAASINGMPTLKYFTYDQNWATDGVDNNGDGAIDDPSEQNMHTLFVSATDGGITRTIESVLAGSDVNVWRNAIFAGSGQAGGLINGNVSIIGSVHLLGNDLPTGAQAIAAIDLSGTSLIHNNYNQMPANFLSRVPALPTVSYNGETVQSLSAKLRVKRGLVGTSGNSEIGEPDVAGNNVKETMDGVYVSDGYTGNKVLADGGKGDPLSLFSDNGWDTNYDLGDRVPFPLLTDDYRDPVTGATVADPVRGGNYSHEHYFDEVLVASPTVANDGIYNGNISISTTTSFYYNASRPADTNPTHRTSTDDYIMFDAATNTMEVNGQITINGNLSFSEHGSDKTINYKGRAAILVHGSCSIDTSLLTVNADGTTANSFPANNCLGIMSSGDMVVGSTSQLSIMGAFYSASKIQTCKQTNVAGSFVSKYFDMGTNVPSIFQVPTLADNLPTGMIGKFPIMVMSQVSWREI